MSSNEITRTPEEIQSLKKFATAVYLMQAATFGVVATYFIAPFLAYWKRGQAGNTWVESHFRWQINTFWFSLTGVAAGVATLATPIGMMILASTSIWFVYRIGQGWTRLSRGQAILGNSSKPS